MSGIFGGSNPFASSGGSGANVFGGSGSKGTSGGNIFGGSGDAKDAGGGQPPPIKKPQFLFSKKVKHGRLFKSNIVGVTVQICTT